MTLVREYFMCPMSQPVPENDRPSAFGKPYTWLASKVAASQSSSLSTSAYGISSALMSRGGGAVLTPLKTAASRRTLALPAEAVTALKAHRVRQLEDRRLAGAQWAQAGDYVFTLPTGAVGNADHARDALQAMLAVANLPRVRFHTLRRSAATLLLGAGVPLFDVSRILGHARSARRPTSMAIWSMR